MGFLSLMPIVLAVALALWSKRALLSLLIGIFAAALILKEWNVWTAILYVIDPLLLDAAASKDNMKVILFSMLVSGTVELMRLGGGTRALVTAFARVATTRPKALVGTWLAGLTVFFDDYANCLIVGSSMQPVTDKSKISREKLAYLVDSTAAPVATLALVSTWIGYEVSLMEKALKAAGSKVNAYGFFLEGLPYRFYPILALVFGFVIASSGRDFGPMLKAETKALNAPSKEIEHSDETKNIWTAILPIILLIGVTGFDLYAQGIEQASQSARLFEIIGAADGYDAMLKGSIAAFLCACLLCRISGLSLDNIGQGIQIGFSRLFEALAVLICAWALGDAISELKTANYLVTLLDGTLSVAFLPSLVFLLAAAISFATGTSFGTMGTLMPITIPLAIQMGAPHELIVASAAAVLSGATWGDHCSPISDTTILSSAGCGCDHIAHVKTQLPYAITAGIISLLVCSIPIGFGIDWTIVLGLGAMCCIGVVFLLGKHPDVVSSESL
ncbi:MAG: sodium:proton antiporter [Proteobacteria bacterium]|nr:sodium:proton antiporter [Pseudomonadota bacterium]